MKNLNHETFVNKWWENISSPLPYDVEEWIQGTYSGDEVFWKENVFDQQEQLLPSSQSHFGKSYDFYHDCIFRHIKTNNTAFSIIKGGKYPDNWNYKRIHHCVNYHIEDWANDQLKAGELIAIVGAPNIHFILALFTALRFGLKICYLPTNSPFLGKGQIIKFLTEIKPKFIATEDPSIVMDGMQQLSINEKGSDEENHAPLSFSYPAEIELQISLSLEQQQEQTLIPLDTHRTYLHALREALFTLNLVQNPYWAAPLACPIRTEPCNTLTSFLSGSTKVYVPEEVIKRNHLVIEDEKINILGISNDLEQLWRQGTGVPTRYLKYCYKNPVEIPNQFWKSFVQLNQLEKIPKYDLLMDNALGGAILCSRPSLDSFNVYLKPVFGTPWYLSDYNGTSKEALTGYGVFQLEEQPPLGNFTATQVENQLMLTGTICPARAGVTFPTVQVEETIAGLPFVEDCMLHPFSKPGTALSHCCVLLVFINPLSEDVSEADREQWTQEIKSRISSNMGTGYLPDKIEYFSLIPKRNLLGLDRRWCANQFNSGLLIQKREFSQYKMLGGLKKLIQQFANQEVS